MEVRFEGESFTTVEFVPDSIVSTIGESARTQELLEALEGGFINSPRLQRRREAESGAEESKFESLEDEQGNEYSILPTASPNIVSETTATEESERREFIKK